MFMNRMNKNNRYSQEEEPSCTKIYYASRTHLQLSQVLPELRKLRFNHLALDNVVENTTGKTLPPHRNVPCQKKRTLEDVDDDQHEADQCQWRSVSLGSRKQLCINEDARSSQGDLDEKCRELLEGIRSINDRAFTDRCWINLQGNKINGVNICRR